MTGRSKSSVAVSAPLPASAGGAAFSTPPPDESDANLQLLMAKQGETDASESDGEMDNSSVSSGELGLSSSPKYDDESAALVSKRNDFLCVDTFTHPA